MMIFLIFLIFEPFREMLTLNFPSFQVVRGRGWRGKASMKEPGVEL